MKIELGEGDERLYDVMALGSLRMILYSAKRLYEGQPGYDQWVELIKKIEAKFNTKERVFEQRFRVVGQRRA